MRRWRTMGLTEVIALKDQLSQISNEIENWESTRDRAEAQIARLEAEEKRVRAEIEPLLKDRDIKFNLEGFHFRVCPPLVHVAPGARKVLQIVFARESFFDLR